MSVKILLVDDHEGVRRGLQTWLGEVFPETCVLVASSGEEALAIIKQDPPHLVLMDITLPGMNGLDATRKIKSVLPSVHIVMFTIHDDKIYRTYASAAGASAYVPKQAMKSDLIPALSSLLADVHNGGSMDTYE